MNQLEIEAVVPVYPDMLDDQRETAFDGLDGLSDNPIWQRPAEKEWWIGEILNHNIKVLARALPYAKFVWGRFRWCGERRRNRHYETNRPTLWLPSFLEWLILFAMVAWITLTAIMLYRVNELSNSRLANSDIFQQRQIPHPNADLS